MQLIDTHFHLDYYRDHTYWYDKINELKQHTLCVTNSPGVYYSCKRLYKETKYVKFALGYNPQRSVTEEFQKGLFLREFKKTRYIGEVGLDFSKDYITTRDKQIDAFDFICRISAQEEKILSVHSRKAEEETLNIMLKNKIDRAIIHWYTGDAKTACKFVDAGYYFSINANMCKTQKGKELLRQIPLNRILIESDGPFSKVESQKYTPLKLEQVYNIVGNAIGQEDLGKTVWNNFRALLTMR